MAGQGGEAIGSGVKDVPADAEVFQKTMRPFVTSDWHSDAVSQLFREIADGTTPGIRTDTFEKIMGRPSRSFQEFLQTIA